MLAHEGHLGLLLATNLDPLVENCYRSRKAHELSLRTFAKLDDFQQATIDRDRRQLAYLHGNLDGYFIANIDEDTRYLKDGVAEAIGRLLDPYQLVVVGYSGRDSSVMNDLIYLAENRPSCFRHGVIYWCRRAGEELSLRARSLLEFIVGDPITVRSWLPLEQPVQAQSPQLVSQLALGALAGIFAPQLGQVRPQIFVTKSTGKQTKQQQQVKQREHHRVGVAQAGDTLLAHLLGRRDLAKRGFAQQASVAGLVPVAASVDRR